MLLFGSFRRPGLAAPSALAFLFAALLSGCGGGGGPAPTSTTYSGTYSGQESGTLTYTITGSSASGQIVSPSLGTLGLTGSANSNSVSLNGSNNIGSASFVGQIVNNTGATRQSPGSTFTGTWTIALANGATLTGTWTAGPVPAGSVLASVTPTSATLAPGASETVTAQDTNGNTIVSNDVTWSSSNPNVSVSSGNPATVTAAASASGTASITATQTSTGHTATTTLTIQPPTGSASGTVNERNQR